MSKYPTAAGVDPEDAARALMSRDVNKSEPILNDEAVDRLLKALRVKTPENLAEDLPEAR